jgi:hypothetical protein
LIWDDPAAPTPAFLTQGAVIWFETKPSEGDIVILWSRLGGGASQSGQVPEI